MLKQKFFGPSSALLPEILGIGLGVHVEQSFLADHRNCSFLGVDPYDEVNRGLVEGLNGTFANIAVDGKAGVHKAIMHACKIKIHQCFTVDLFSWTRFFSRRESHGIR